MQSTLALIALVALVTAQNDLTCVPSVDFKFELSIQNQSDPNPEKVTNGVCNTNPIIQLTQGGILTDQDNRRAEVVANGQFQFDVVLQSERLYDEGFEICSDTTVSRLSHQLSNTTFYSGLSGGFSNLYASNQQNADYYVPIYLNIVQCGNQSPPSTPKPISSQGSAMSEPTAIPTGTVANTASAAPSATTTSSASTSAAVVTSSTPTATAAAAPFPTGNSTVPAGTASAPATTATTSAPATFTAGSGASNLAVTAKLVALVAGVFAFAMV